MPARIPLLGRLTIPDGGLLFVHRHAVARCKQESGFDLATRIPQVRALPEPLRRSTGVAGFAMHESQISVSQRQAQAGGAFHEFFAFLHVLWPPFAIAITNPQQIHGLGIPNQNQPFAQVGCHLIIPRNPESVVMAPGDRKLAIFHTVIGRH